MSFLKNMKSARVVASIGLGILAACSESNGPQAGEFDTARVEAGIATVQRVAAAPVLSSLTATGRVAGGFASASLAGGASDWSGLETAVQRVASATAGAGAALIPVMRPSVLGKTFVYDASTRQYVPDASRTGGPTNGVRFVLYETGGNGEPVPGREIGYADLTDERRTSPTTAGVRLVVVSGGITHLDYAFDLTGSVDADELHALGSIVKVAEGLFELVGGLLAPAGALLLIALGVS